MDEKPDIDESPEIYDADDAHRTDCINLPHQPNPGEMTILSSLPLLWQKRIMAALVIRQWFGFRDAESIRQLVEVVACHDAYNPPTVKKNFLDTVPDSQRAAVKQWVAAIAKQVALDHLAS
jgi:hypothetical protein